MSTITVPEGFQAVVVMIPKDEKVETKVEFVGIDASDEHLFAADAIGALTGTIVDTVEELLDGEPEEDEPEAKPS